MMWKKWAILGGLVCLMAAPAGATPFLDVNGDHTGSVYMSGWCNPSETWVFDLDNDILDIGDIEAGDTILCANLSISIQDCDPWDCCCWQLEFTDLLLDGSLVANDVEVDPGTYVTNVLAWVSDHVLHVTLSDVYGDFTVTSMSVSGCYCEANTGGEDPGEPSEPVVPEPATLTLLGLGLCGLGALRRRRTAQKVNC